MKHSATIDVSRASTTPENDPNVTRVSGHYAQPTQRRNVMESQALFVLGGENDAPSDRGRD